MIQVKDTVMLDFCIARFTTSMAWDRISNYRVSVARTLTDPILLDSMNCVPAASSMQPVTTGAAVATPLLSQRDIEEFQSSSLRLLLSLCINYCTISTTGSRPVTRDTVNKWAP